MVGANGARPNMGVRPDAPTVKTIVPVTFYEIVNLMADSGDGLFGPIRENVCSSLKPCPLLLPIPAGEEGERILHPRAGSAMGAGFRRE